MGPDFLQLFGKVHAAIGALTGFIDSMHDRYAESSNRSNDAENRAHRAEQKLAEVEGELADQKRVNAEITAKYASVIEVMADNEEEKRQAREVAKNAAQLAADSQTALVAAQDAATKSKAAYDAYVLESEARDKEQDAERADVFERLAAVTTSIEGLTAPEPEDAATTTSNT